MIEEGSGNVFEDLRLPNPQEELAKANLKTIELADGGLLHYYKEFFPKSLADKSLDYLKKLPWKQETTGFGRKFPRLTAWYAEDGLKYSYSGVTHVGEGWKPILLEIKNKVDAVSGVVFNSLLLNYYRDGSDSIGWHTDAESELGENPVVSSVTFGAARDFHLKHKNGVKVGKVVLSLEHGSLLVMAGTTQHHWLHSVPKVESAGERVNLTFRRIL